MKTNEEFLKEVYGKRDAIVKKRKKQMAFTATAVCAVLCVGVAVTAGIFGGKSIDKTQTEYEHSMVSNKSGAEDHKLYYNTADATKYNSEFFYPATVPNPDDYSFVADDGIDLSIEDIPETATEIAIEGVPDSTVGYDGEQEEGAAEYTGETVTMNGSAVIEPATEALKNGDVNEIKPTMPAAPKNPMPSTEEIVEAAYNALSPEIREYAVKDSAEATVTMSADGTQTYEVYFHLNKPLPPEYSSNSQYVKVRLDTQLNKIS